VSARFAFTGLNELIAELRALPADLRDEAGIIVQSHAYTAAQAIRNAYGQHRYSGDLADHVVVARASTGPFGVGMVVRSTARHSWLFENGSQVRYYLGASRGSMPAAPTFIPIMMRFRRSMYLGLADLVRRHGLVVSGDA